MLYLRLTHTHTPYYEPSLAITKTYVCMSFRHWSMVTVTLKLTIFSRATLAQPLPSEVLCFSHKPLESYMYCKFQATTVCTVNPWVTVLGLCVCLLINLYITPQWLLHVALGSFFKCMCVFWNHNSQIAVEDRGNPNCESRYAVHNYVSCYTLQH